MWVNPASLRVYGTYRDVHLAYRNVSFPSVMSAGVVLSLGLAPLLPAAPPAYDPATETVEETTPLRVNGVWTQQWAVRALTPEELQARVPRAVTALQGLRAIHAAGLAPAFLEWKAGLDPIADFEALAFVDKAQTWVYDDPTLVAALAALGLTAQRDTLFTLAATL